VGLQTLSAVTFDLWQTLLMDTPQGLRQAQAERIHGIHRILAGQGVSVQIGAVEQAYDAVWEKLQPIWASHGDLGSRGQVRLLLEILDVNGAIPADGPIMDALDDAYCRPILDAMPVANTGAREVLDALTNRGLRLGLICNTGRTPGRMLRLVLERLGLFSFLSVLSFSDELELRKPHPEIFHRTLGALGVRPEEAVHIGDDVTTDVAGARGVGMRPIHLLHATSVSQDSRGAESVGSLLELPMRLFPPSAQSVVSSG
jgi:putative hydrolase of the HAD superfamily